MLFITVVNLIAVLILFMGKFLPKRFNVLPYVILFLIAVFSIRWNYTNDFDQYLNMFKFIRSNSMAAVHERYFHVENGWILLNYLFGSIGYTGVLTVVTAAQFGSIGFLIHKYVDRKHQWLVMAVYLFTPWLMMTQLSMVRQTMAMSGCLFAIPLLLNRKYLYYVGVCLLMMFFHKSAFFATLFVFVPYLASTKTKWFIPFFGALAVFLIIVMLPEAPLKMLDSLLESDSFEKYSVYGTRKYGATKTNTSIVMYFNMIMSLYMIYSLRRKTTRTRPFIILFAINYIMAPLATSIGMIARLGWYGLLPGILSFDQLASQCRKDLICLGLVGAYLFVMLTSYVSFFYDPLWIHKYLQYRTIFGTII